MGTKLNPSKISGYGGIFAALLFWLAFVSYLLAVPDAQNGIALFFSPFYAMWIGVSVGLILRGSLSFRGSESKERFSREGAILCLVIGIIGLGIITTFLAGEYYQATHPTNINRN